MNVTDSLAEANRVITVCNSCGDCYNACAVFPAMDMHYVLGRGELSYIANLCHDCGACYIDCELALQHEFDINVPRLLAIARVASYETHTWPSVFSIFFRRSGLAIALLCALCVSAFMLIFLVVGDSRPAFLPNAEVGSFYRVMPHDVMAVLFGSVFVYAVFAMALQTTKFWRSIGEPARSLFSRALLKQALRDAASLRYLDGDSGCFNAQDGPDSHRRLYHHFTFYGFALCFAATTVGTIYHYLLWREAPYAWWDAPAALGAFGGLGLVVGTAGLLRAKLARDPARVDADRVGMEVAFIVMLFLTGFSGLSLFALRATPAMGVLLPIHLGIVFTLFLMLPYSKFVHGLYRFSALVRYSRESAARSNTSDNQPERGLSRDVAPPKIVGYAGGPAPQDDPFAQMDALREAGCALIFEERDNERGGRAKELERALDCLQKGDVLVVWQLDRLASSLRKLELLLTDLRNRGIGLRCVDPAIDTTTPDGDFLFSIEGYVSKLWWHNVKQRSECARPPVGLSAPPANTRSLIEAQPARQTQRAARPSSENGKMEVPDR